MAAPGTGQPCLVQKARALSCDVLICTGKILSNIPEFCSPSITSHSHTRSASCFSLKRKRISVLAWGGVSGDGSCSLFQKHKACVLTDSNNSFTWSELDKGLKNVVHEECGTKWLQIGRSRVLQEVVTLAQLSAAWQVRRAGIVLCHLGCKFLAEALIYCSTSSNLHAEVSVSFMPSPQIAYPHETGNVSVY